MVLKLDPRIPLVWRDPTSLQFGVASPVAVLTDVSEADERMIAALSAGISRSGLSMVGRAAGALEQDVESLLALVQPALVGEVAATVPTVLVVGTGATSDQLAIDLAASGLRVLVARDVAAAASTDCDLAVVVAHYIVAPELHGLWLRRDIPHLAVVIRDTDSVIGPIVEPGSGPCLHCIQRHRTEADAAWPAIATQLATRRPATESPLTSAEAAAVTARLVSRRLRDGAAATATSVTIDSATGAAAELAWLPHPDCGCIDLGVSGAGRSESGSPDAGHPDAATLQPTIGRASSALA